MIDSPDMDCSVGEIKLGGTYSNQVATLEAKIDALTLDVRSMEDKLDIVLIGLGHKCNCGGVLHEGCGNDGDEVYGKSPGYTAFKVEKDRQAGINTLTHDEVA